MAQDPVAEGDPGEQLGVLVRCAGKTRPAPCSLRRLLRPGSSREWRRARSRDRPPDLRPAPWCRSSTPGASSCSHSTRATPRTWPPRAPRRSRSAGRRSRRCRPARPRLRPASRPPRPSHRRRSRRPRPRHPCPRNGSGALAPRRTNLDPATRPRRRPRARPPLRPRHHGFRRCRPWWNSRRRSPFRRHPRSLGRRAPHRSPQRLRRPGPRRYSARRSPTARSTRWGRHSDRVQGHPREPRSPPPSARERARSSNARRTQRPPPPSARAR